VQNGIFPSLGLFLTALFSFGWSVSSYKFFVFSARKSKAQICGLRAAGRGLFNRGAWQNRTLARLFRIHRWIVRRETEILRKGLLAEHEAGTKICGL
jgi:hypothetical protein